MISFKNNYIGVEKKAFFSSNSMDNISNFMLMVNWLL